MTPDGEHVYVVNEFSNTVSVIATATNTLAGTIAVGAKPVGIAITPDGTHAYVTNRVAKTVSVIDTAVNLVTATIGVGASPQGVGIVPASPGRVTFPP